MDEPGGSVQGPRVVAQVLTGWRQAVHVGMHGLLVLGCGFGLVSSALVGCVVTHKLTGKVLAEHVAGGAGTSVLMVVIAGLAVVVLAKQSRRPSWIAALLMAFVPVVVVVTVFFAIMESPIISGWSLRTMWQSQVEVHTELWPVGAVRAVTLGCLGAGPLALMVHGLAWLTEDESLRRSAKR